MGEVYSKRDDQNTSSLILMHQMAPESRKVTANASIDDYLNLQ